MRGYGHKKIWRGFINVQELYRYAVHPLSGRHRNDGYASTNRGISARCVSGRVAGMDS